MPPSRRSVLSLATATALSTVAGCSTSSIGIGNGNGSGSGNGTTAPSGSRTDATPTPTVAVRLIGPETDVRLFDAADVATVGDLRSGGSGVVLPVELTAEATSHVTERFRAAGVGESPDDFELVLRHGGEPINRFGIAPGFAASVAGGEWTGRFLLSFEDRGRAERVSKALAAVDGTSTDRPADASTTTSRPPASDALVVRSAIPVEGTMVNLGAEGAAENTAPVALVACIVEATGTVGGRTFGGQARRDRLAPDETWEWEVAFGEEADAMDDDSVEDLSVSTTAKYAT